MVALGQQVVHERHQQAGLATPKWAMNKAYWAGPLHLSEKSEDYAQELVSYSQQTIAAMGVSPCVMQHKVFCMKMRLCSLYDSCKSVETMQVLQSNVLPCWQVR